MYSHSSKSQTSLAALKLLKDIELKREEDRKPFTLEVTEEPATATQLSNIIDIAGHKNVGDIVRGAIDKREAVRIGEKYPEQFQRPLVVDWGNAKVVIGGDQGKIKALIDSLE